MIGIPVLMGLLTTWLTPLWLLGVGAAASLLVLGALYGLAALVAPGLAAFVRMSVREGILLPLLFLIVFLSGFALLATPVVPYRSLLGAVSRIPSVGDEHEVVTVPPGTKDFAIPLFFRPGELQAHKQRQHAAEDEEGEGSHDIAAADNLVIDGRKRAKDTARRAPYVGQDSFELRSVECRISRVRRKRSLAHRMLAI